MDALLLSKFQWKKSSIRAYHFLHLIIALKLVTRQFGVHTYMEDTHSQRANFVCFVFVYF